MDEHKAESKQDQKRGELNVIEGSDEFAEAPHPMFFVFPFAAPEHGF